jgi:hypothetical protein
VTDYDELFTRAAPSCGECGLPVCRVEIDEWACGVVADAPVWTVTRAAFVCDAGHRVDVPLG